MTELFNKISNQDWGGSTIRNTGDSIMAFGDTTVLAVGEYKCTDGTCADTSQYMLYTLDLYGSIKCVDDNASATPKSVSLV